MFAYTIIYLSDADTNTLIEWHSHMWYIFFFSIRYAQSVGQPQNYYPGTCRRSTDGTCDGNIFIHKYISF